LALIYCEGEGTSGEHWVWGPKDAIRTRRELQIEPLSIEQHRREKAIMQTSPSPSINRPESDIGRIGVWLESEQFEEGDRFNEVGRVVRLIVVVLSDTEVTEFSTTPRKPRWGPCRNYR